LTTLFRHSCRFNSTDAEQSRNLFSDSVRNPGFWPQKDNGKVKSKAINLSRLSENAQFWNKQKINSITEVVCIYGKPLLKVINNFHYFLVFHDEKGRKALLEAERNYINGKNQSDSFQSQTFLVADQMPGGTNFVSGTWESIFLSGYEFASEKHTNKCFIGYKKQSHRIKNKCNTWRDVLNTALDLTSEYNFTYKSANPMDDRKSWNKKIDKRKDYGLDCIHFAKLMAYTCSGKKMEMFRMSMIKSALSKKESPKNWHPLELLQFFPVRRIATTDFGFVNFNPYNESAMHVQYKEKMFVYKENHGIMKGCTKVYCDKDFLKHYYKIEKTNKDGCYECVVEFYDSSNHQDRFLKIDSGKWKDYAGINPKLMFRIIERDMCTERDIERFVDENVESGDYPVGCIKSGDEKKDENVDDSFYFWNNGIPVGGKVDSIECSKYMSCESCTGTERKCLWAERTSPALDKPRCRSLDEQKSAIKKNAKDKKCKKNKN